MTKSTSPLPPSARPPAPRAPAWRRELLFLSLGAVAVVALALAILLPRWRADARPYNGASITPALQVPELTLRHTDGQPFSTAVTRGRLSLFFFGYTNCPDVCPLTLFHIMQIRKQLGASASAVDSYFVTVDPERDTPERLGEYVRRVDPAIIPLTGTDEELTRIREVFGVVAQKRPAPNSAAGYFVDHTGSMFLVDRESRISLVYQFGTEDQLIVEDLQRLIRR